MAPRRSDRDDEGDGVETAYAIEAEGLVKHFGETRAVDGVDLRVPVGGVYAVLGPNGAGKTTAIRVLATLLSPTAGTARVFGYDVVADADAVRSEVSLTGQYASVDEDLTAVENLVLLSRLWGFDRSAARARAATLLEAFGLTDAGSRQVKTFSGGMRRRIDIAASIVVAPRLIFLDEPTTGLDPRSRNQVWDIVRALVDAGTTVLLTTQYLEEADQLADRVAVIDRGRVIAEGTVGELKASVGTGVVSLRLTDPARRDEAAALATRETGADAELDRDPTSMRLRVASAAAAARLVTVLDGAGLEVAQVDYGQPSLDEVFLTLTGRPAADATERPDDIDATVEA